ncbi:MAG: glycosyltransferase family 2 protein [Candidatus Rokuibacteriota bacterium]
MSAVPRASVIIPCYNLGRYLDEAVASVLAQTLQDFEILVVDDGSTEPETRRLLAEYRQPKTRVIHSDNRGLPAAKNLGIQETTGAYVCALDADDRLEPTMLEKSVRVLDEDPSLAFVSHWLRSFGDEEREWTPERCDFPALLDMNTVNGAALVRREAVMAVGGFDETMRQGCEDWDLWISLVERGFRGAILPEVLFRYRKRADSMTVAMQGETHFELYRYLIEKHKASYRRHLPELLLRRESSMCDLLRHAHDLGLEYEASLKAELSNRRDEVRILRAKMEHATPEVEQLRAEVRALRGSMSWKITAPLRVVYGWLLRLMRDS